MTRTLAFIFALLLLVLLSGCSSKEPTRPNIILILADDFGYMDSQVYAARLTGTDKSEMYYETPNIDMLSGEGVSFSRAYANQLCSPTRASILTGKYAGRLGFTTAAPPMKTFYNTNQEVPDGRSAHELLQSAGKIKNISWLNGACNTAVPAGTIHDRGKDEVSIAEALPGYHSAFIGKWHLGGIGAEGYQPADQGFHPIAWYDAGGSQYFNWRQAWNVRSKDRFPEIPQEEWEMGDAGEETGQEYLTDDLTAQALNYLDKRAGISDQPFFLYFCHFAVHGPWQARKQDSTYFANKDTKGWNNHNDPSYAGMIRGLDNSVGLILEKLEKTGLEKNTLVIFMSDNGGFDSKITNNRMATDNSPLRGGKACLTEGGIRVPLILRWKGKISAGKWCNVPVDCTDLFATVIDAAGYDLEHYYTSLEIDGRSLMPLLNDLDNSGGIYEHGTRYWHYPCNVAVLNPFDGKPLTPHSAIMEGYYKLIFDWHGRLRLFDLETDLEENHNLAHEMPHKTRELFAKLATWLEGNIQEQYWPVINQHYDPMQEVREDAPFVDLYTAYKEGKDIINLAH